MNHHDHHLLGLEIVPSNDFPIDSSAAVPSTGRSVDLLEGPQFASKRLRCKACRGPIEYDLAYVPEHVAAHYAGADHNLPADCRGLVLARLALLRGNSDDQLPSGAKQLPFVLAALRQGPPWPTVDALYGKQTAPLFAVAKSAAGPGRAVVDSGAQLGLGAELVKASLVVLQLGGAEQLTTLSTPPGVKEQPVVLPGPSSDVDLWHQLVGATSHRFEASPTQSCAGYSSVSLTYSANTKSANPSQI